MPDNKNMPSDKNELRVEVFYQTGDDPFICGVEGRATIYCLSEIEKDCRENYEEVFKLGDGQYLFEAQYNFGQCGQYGVWEIVPYWELELLAYTPCVDEEGGK